MQCASCKLENPPTAQRCDCGAPLGVAVTPVVRKTEGTLARGVWVLPIFGALAAAAQLVTSWDAQQGAPQQAALAGLSLCLVVIPYCLARAVAGLMGE